MSYTGNTTTDQAVSIQGNSGNININYAVERWRKKPALNRGIWKYDYYESLLRNRYLRKHNTGRWIFESAEYKQWLAEGGCLWCHGIPGAGKTLLAPMLVDELKPLYFFFDHSQADSLDARCAFASLIRQMLERYKAMKKEVDSEIDELLDDDCGVFRLAYILNRLVTNEIYLIDGLDQCEANKEVFLDHLQGKRVLLLSRHERDVEKLKPLTIALEERSQSDVEAFIEENFACSGTLQAELKLGLKQGAKGMLLWTDLMMKYISRLRTDAELRECLMHIPDGLDELYDRCISRLTDWARKILLWTTHARRPLREDELREAIAIDLKKKWRPEDVPNDIYALVDECANLVVLQNNTVSLIHHTLRQYLQGEDPLGPLCIHYLSTFELAPTKTITIPSVRAMFLKTKPVKVSIESLDSARSAIWSYASENWHFHFQHVKQSSPEFKAFKAFVLSPRLVTVMPNYEPGSSIEQCILAWAIDVDRADVLKELFSPSALKDLLKRDKELPLARAVVEGRLSVLQCLQGFFKLEAKDARGRTLLHLAAAQGRYEVIPFCKNVFVINQRDKDGFTPLHHACYHGHVRAVHSLRDPLLDFWIKDKAGKCALRHAQMRGHRQAAQAAAQLVDLKSQNDRLLLAVQEGRASELSKILDTGADIYYQSLLEGSLVTIAVGDYAAGCIPELMRSGFKPEDASDAMLLACHKGYSEAIEALALSGVAVDFPDVKSPLMCAATAGDIRAVKAVLAAKADIDYLFNGHTALHHAMGPRSAHRLCCGLIEDNVDISFSLHGRSLKTVELLLGAGANPNLGSPSPLRISICQHATRLLLRAGATLDEHSRYGSALHGAAFAADLEAAKLLLEAGANVNSVCSTLGSPLHAAISPSTVRKKTPQRTREVQRMVKLLIEHGADVNIKWNDRPLIYDAIEFDDWQVESALRDAGATV